MGSPLKTRQSYENDTLCPLPPSGITDFEEFRKKGFVYVDKTRFIEKMERLSLYFPFIIRLSSEQIYPQRKRQKLPSPSFLSFLLFSVVLFKFLF